MALPIHHVLVEFDLDGKAKQKTKTLSWGEYHFSFTAPELFLEYRYHDQTPAAGASFAVELDNGKAIEGHLDEVGQARVKRLGARPVRVRFGLPPRPFALVDHPNPLYRFDSAAASQSDATAIDPQYQSGRTVLSQAEEIALSCVSWVWGTAIGNFNEKQSVSQILVDAVIGMIPLVGLVTAARDLLAVILGMVNDPKKRTDKLEWLSLTVLTFALIPVLGGALKGVGKLLLHVSAEMGHAATKADALRSMVAVLNHMGIGDALQWLKTLNLEAYSQDLVSRYRELNRALDIALNQVQGGIAKKMPISMQRRITALRQGLHEIDLQVGQRIPESVKELSERLKAAQHQIYQGDWHAVPKSLKVQARIPEAKLVEMPDGKKWSVKDMKYPPSGLGDFKQKKNWPDLSDESNGYYFDRTNPTKPRPAIIPCFSGEIEPVFIPEGETLYRIVENADTRIGSWWVFGLPPEPRQWREGAAVLDSWNKNGFYVEMKAPKGGLYAWGGKAAGQVQNDVDKAKESLGQYLEGGGYQLFIDLHFDANKAGMANISGLLPTNWPPESHLGINIASKKTAAHYLDLFETETQKRVLGTLGEKATRQAGEPVKEK